MVLSLHLSQNGYRSLPHDDKTSVVGANFFEGLEIGHFWEWVANGGLEITWKGGGAKPPTFLEGCQAPRGHTDPKIDRFPILKNCRMFY
jgi:hypothetical protein